MPFLETLASTIILLLGIALCILVVVFILDISQTKDAIRRNFPVIGHFRDIFITLGEFFRQYFFAMDREEMPFNRAERNWVKHAASDGDQTVAFGSTKNLTPAGTAIFVNSPFPALERSAAHTQPLRIGPTCQHPYDAPSIFNISGMSYGAISRPAVKALSHGARIAGCWLNTGEGGLSPYHLEGGADVVLQIGTAKYGVRDADGNLDDTRLREVAGHNEVKMIELKLSQGAKPGKGGILPGAKVTDEIATIRGITAGQDSISPNRHPEINSTRDLLDMINHIREVTGKPVGFKCALGNTDWLDEVFTEINKRGSDAAPDFITIDSGDGGTGAAPMPLIDNVGMLIREALPQAANLRDRYGLKERIRLIASGKLITSSAVAWALCAGADFVTSARGFMFSLGCIQAMRCNKNTCPTGVTTHNPRLQKGLDPTDKSVKVANYARNLMHEVEVIAHSCGVKEPRELTRAHVRIVQPDGSTAVMSSITPSS